MTKKTRRDFIKFGGLSLATLPLTIKSEAFFKNQQRKPMAIYQPLKLGLASYTFREFSLEDALSMIKRLGLERITIKSIHLPLESAKEKIKAVAEKVKLAGLELYGCGVVYMKNEREVHQAFEYAQAAGMQIIIGVPDHELLDLVNKKVQEFDIKLALHNHGPADKLYPTPESAYAKIAELDPRLGLCLDVGHTQRAGVDPSDAAKKCADRLLDVHIKDVTASTDKGIPIEIGRGVVDIPKFLRTLVKLNYSGTVALEYEKDEKDPLPGAAESIGYVRGVLAAI
jgi:inosose dehydratase